MWKKDKCMINKIDSKIVRGDYIIADGYTHSYRFCHEKESPLKRDLTLPIFYLLKVHKNHPIRVCSSGYDYTSIFPLNEKRWPAEVHGDRKTYDLTSLLMVPHEIKGDTFKWENLVEKNDWFTWKGKNKLSTSLLYLEYGASIDSDSLYKISFVMPSQVIHHIFQWLKRPQEISSHEKSFDQKLEGRIEIPLDEAKKLSFSITEKLEKRYKTKLLFEK